MNHDSETERILKRFRMQKMQEYTFRLENYNCRILYDFNLKQAISPIEKILKKCTKFLVLKSDLTFIVVNTSNEFVKRKMMGVTGYTWGKHVISIEINIGNPRWIYAIAGTVAHEFNHSARFNYIKGDFTLEDTIAFEGLAQCFETKVTKKLPPWSKAITKDEAQKVWLDIQPRLKSKSSKLYRDLFFGSNKFQKWSGYTLSYIVVKKQLSNLDWNDAIKLNSKVLLGL